MALKFFNGQIKRLIDTKIPEIEVITDDDEPRHIIILFKGKAFDISINDLYPFTPFKIHRINADGTYIPINILDKSEWNPAISLSSVVYSIMIDYMADDIADISILNSMRE